MKTLLTLMLALLAPALVTDALAAAPKNKALTDAQITAVLIAANEVDIDTAKFVESKTSSDLVKKYTQRIVAEHTDANHQVKELDKQLGITPEETKLSKSIRSDRKRTDDRLKKLTGGKLDTAYLNDEIVFHRQVIDILDSQLIPSASSEELKKLLVQLRPGLVSHLEFAEQTLYYVDQMR